MLFLFVTVIVINLMSISNVFSSLTPSLPQIVGKQRYVKIMCLKNMLKNTVMRKLGYYGCVQAVYLHSPGHDRKEITVEVKRVDANGGKFLTSANFIFHPLKLPYDATVEVHGKDNDGVPYKFVFFSDSEIFVPLHKNHDPFGKKSLVSAEARFLDKVRDITDLARTWTSCNSELEDVLPFLARDLFRIDDDLSTAALEAPAGERIEVHALYSDLSVKKLETNLS